MELSLAVAEACGPTTCEIRLVEGGGRQTACYGERVQDRIKVRPGDLVAVDRSVEPPAVVWRWWHGRIERLEGDRAAVSRNHNQPTPEHPRRATAELPVAPELVGRLETGDTVYFDREAGVLDVARSGVPAHPDRLAALLPSVAAAYERDAGV
jgi:hypothetical protein